MKNVCHLIDNMEFMKDIPDKFYDLAIVDPPYGLKWNSTGGQSISKEEAEKANKWDVAPKKEYFDKILKISKNVIIWGANHFLEHLGNAKSIIIWDKKMRGMHFADGEMAWTSFKNGALRIFELAVRNQKGTRFHPTQKPIELYKWLLQNYAKPGYKIFDSHVGSGSIRIACHDMGFEFEGCELDKDYWQAQEERFQNHINQQSLFNQEEIQNLVYKESELFNDTL